LSLLSLGRRAIASHLSPRREGENHSARGSRAYGRTATHRLPSFCQPRSGKHSARAPARSLPSFSAAQPSLSSFLAGQKGEASQPELRGRTAAGDWALPFSLGRRLIASRLTRPPSLRLHSFCREERGIQSVPAPAGSLPSFSAAEPSHPFFLPGDKGKTNQSEHRGRTAGRRLIVSLLSRSPSLRFPSFCPPRSGKHSARAPAHSLPSFPAAEPSLPFFLPGEKGKAIGPSSRP
jgi:hypothetical protein